MSIRDQVKSYTLHNLGMTEEEYEAEQKKIYGLDEKVRKKFYAIVVNSDHLDVLGDYDCDGITATYIMYKLFSSTLHKDVDFLIPDRITDGYGIQNKLIDRIYERRKDAIHRGECCTIVTVDNGIVGAESVDYAKSLGFRVIVTDHHELGDHEIPKADLVIDPKVEGCNPFDYDGYCGAGVAYKLAEQYVRNWRFVRHLRAFAALGTVADVMELTGDNRKIVKTALNELANVQPIPMKLLADAYRSVTGREFCWEDLTEKDFGFLFGPILNAQSRMDDVGASFAENYLLNPDMETAVTMVQTNEERKELTKSLMTTVEEKISSDNVLKSPFWLYVPKVKEGVIGILAGNIVERYGIPCIVLTDTEDEKILKGSARSIDGFNIFDYLSKDVPQDIFERYGGHAGAAGLSVYREKLPKIEALPDLSVRAEAGHLIPDLVIPQDHLDEAYQAIREFAPFGQGNPDPLVGVPMDVQETKPYLCGADKNTALFFNDNGKVTVFRYNEMTNGLDTNRPFYAVGTLSAERYKGKKGINLIASELEDERTLEKEKSSNLKIR